MSSIFTIISSNDLWKPLAFAKKMSHTPLQPATPPSFRLPKGVLTSPVLQCLPFPRMTPHPTCRMILQEDCWALHASLSLEIKYKTHSIVCYIDCTWGMRHSTWVNASLNFKSAFGSRTTIPIELIKQTKNVYKGGVDLWHFRQGVKSLKAPCLK